MYQRKRESVQRSNIDHLWSVPGKATLSSKRLKVLFLGPGGRQDHYTQILAANVQQWGYEASILTTSTVAGGGAQNVEVEGDVLVYDLDDPPYVATLSVAQTSDEVSFVTPFLAKLDKGWPRVRLMIALSSRSVSRLTLEQIGAVALLNKPFEIERLQRYLQVFQQVLLDDADRENGNGAGFSQSAVGGKVVREHAYQGYERSVRILVVEDHPHVADTMRQCLEFEPRYDIRIAEDGLNALKECVEWQPHCIVTDLLLPYMDGYQVMRTLSAAGTRQLPAFVVISALTQHELPESHVYPHGKSVVFIDKPFQIENLLDAVEQALT
ncbi:MAG: response regulator [Ktedonobacteraceae bacterium]